MHVQHANLNGVFRRSSICCLECRMQKERLCTFLKTIYPVQPDCHLAGRAWHPIHLFPLSLAALALQRSRHLSDLSVGDRF